MKRVNKRLLEEGEIVNATDEIKVKVEKSYGRYEWKSVPSLYVGKPKRILSNPIRRIV